MSSNEGLQLLEEPQYHPRLLGDLETECSSAEFPFEAVDNDVSATASERPVYRGRPSPPRSLTFLNSVALVVGLQIGSGIFSAPSAVRTFIPSPAVATSVWILAGFLVWTGAASFIELGTRVPENGGIQEYLRHCYGDIYGFLFAWVWILVSRPCAMAMVALIFSEYLFKAILPDQVVSAWVLKGTAFLAIASVTYLNCLGTHIGAGAANLFLMLKVFGLSSIAITGLVFAFNSFAHQPGIQRSNGNEKDQFTASLFTDPRPAKSWLWVSLGNFTEAVLAALFAYGGWESIGFVVGEIKDPHYTLPRVLNSSMIMVIILFVLVNITFYTTLSLEVLQNTNAVAIAFGTEIFGRCGGLFYAWVVCLSCLGALNAIIFSTSRLTQAAGARHYLPAFLNAAADFTTDSPRDGRGREGPRGPTVRAWLFSNQTRNQNSPINAMVLNAGAAAVYVFAGTFRGLLSFKGMAEYVVYLATVSGVLFLRFHSGSADNEPRSGLYRTQTFNPLIFCCIAALVVIRSAITHVLQALVIALFFGTASLVYQSRWWQKLAGMTPALDSS